MATQNEQALQLEIHERWSPYLQAVGIDTSDWQPYEVYKLAEIVWRDKDVAKAGKTLHLAWALNRMHEARNEPDMTPETITYEQVRGWVAPDLTLQSVQVLPAAKKADLKARVLNARARNMRRDK
jgi:hypothetical protein